MNKHKFPSILNIFFLIISALSSGCRSSTPQTTSTCAPQSTPDPGGVWAPNWSPTGNLIAFRCVFVSSDDLSFSDIDDHECPDRYDIDLWSDICVADQNGKQFRRLTSGGDVSNYMWSPDGKSLAWVYYSDFAPESVSIWNSQEETTETFSVPEHLDWYSLNWSKDGEQFSLFSDGAVFEVQNDELSTIPKQEITGNEFFDFRLSFDNEYLAFERYTAFPDGQPDLIISKNGKPVYTGYEYIRGGSYAWSPSDNILAWIGIPTQKDVEHPKLTWEYDTAILFFTYAPTGETIRYGAVSSDFGDQRLFWSVDGRRLAILDTYDGDIEIFKFAQTDLGFPLSIVSHSSLDFAEIEDYYEYNGGGLSWSPNGEQIMIGNDYKLWLINAQDNSKQTFLIDYP